MPQVIKLGGSYTLKVTLTTQEGESPKKPHQAFLQLKDPDTGLDISYPFSVKDNGKARLELVGCGMSSISIVIITTADKSGLSDAG